MSSDYRPEIDGLRAFAVVPVVLFHADVPGFSGGYVGVDIFFVISGFLITRILLRSIHNQQFSLLQFYERRIRRIFPALFTVLVVTTVCASWLLFPSELINYGGSLFATSLFYANYHFMSDTGYFAAPAESKPLLHMWSLAVEEQFYLIFPVYLYAVCRWCQKWKLTLTLALCILSMVHCILLTENSPNQAFFSAVTRAWELMFGSILAMTMARSDNPAYLRPFGAGLLSIVGLALICTPVVLYSEATRFPGVMAIPPVAGAALVLLATSSRGNPVTRLLALPVIRFIGLISYSLYLWHWPVIVLIKTYAIEPLNVSQRLLLLSSVLVLATLTWLLVETPLRMAGKGIRHASVIGAGLAVMLLSLGIGAALEMGDGLPNRFSSQVQHILRATSDTPTSSDCRPLVVDKTPRVRFCALGAERGTAPSFIVWGDSHAEALLPSISEAARTAGKSGFAFVRDGCPALVGVRQLRDGFRDCDQTAEAFFKYLADHPEINEVVMISRWAIYAVGYRYFNEMGATVLVADDEAIANSATANHAVFERGLVRTLDRLAKLERHVTVITQVPETEYPIPLSMARAAHLDRNVDLAPSHHAYLARQESVERVFSRHLPNSDVAVLRPDQLLCSSGSCLIAIEGTPIYRDTNHLTRGGALAMTKLFQPLFSR